MKNSFTTVIATHNRSAVLATALPLHLSQSRLPAKIIIIDSSEDPTPNIELVKRLNNIQRTPVIHEISAPGTSYQRNIGLQRVETDVVFLPDDDSLLYPETTSGLMEIYDLDRSKAIGGVGALGAIDPPTGLQINSNKTKMRRRDLMRSYVSRSRVKIENRFFPDPMKVASHSLQGKAPNLDCTISRKGVSVVEWITGYRMSFRTEAIRKYKFNEHLGRYALYEDIDAGLSVQAGGQLLVTTPNARIHHHKDPSIRSNGYEMGVMNILNRAYVALRRKESDDEFKKIIRRYSQFRTTQFWFGAADSFGRDRWAGAKRASGVLDDLFLASPSTLDETYVTLRKICLNRSE